MIKDEELWCVIEAVKRLTRVKRHEDRCEGFCLTGRLTFALLCFTEAIGQRKLSQLLLFVTANTNWFICRRYLWLKKTIRFQIPN